ncbi:MAG: class I SAM-dependent methyltransferase [Ancalomicrobiaceae bacterium]|nr:class I SAM-dependent methyltransferase [Ancalomicrobiaceae bacterium]
MDAAEFDKFAEEYRQLHTQNIKASGETPDYFADYKVRDVAVDLARHSLPERPRLLDFGCGVGSSMPYFRKYLPEAQVTGLDVSRKSLELAEQQHAGAAEFLWFDGGKLPFEDRSFDVVFTACVFHHIPADEHERLFAEIRRVLKPAAPFFIFEHNPRNPLTVHAVNTCPFDENAVLIDAATIRRRLEAAGFAETRAVYRIFFPRMLKALRAIEPYLRRVPFGAQYYVEAIA